MPSACSDVNGLLGSKEWFQSHQDEPIVLAITVQLMMYGCVSYCTMHAKTGKSVVSTKNMWKTSECNELKNPAMNSCGNVIMV